MITTQALDLYARIGCGQMEELIRVMTRLQLLNFNDPDYLEKVNLIRSYLDDIKRIIGLTATSSHGIHKGNKFRCEADGYLRQWCRVY